MPAERWNSAAQGRTRLHCLHDRAHAPHSGCRATPPLSLLRCPPSTRGGQRKSLPPELPFRAGKITRRCQKAARRPPGASWGVGGSRTQAGIGGRRRTLCLDQGLGALERPTGLVGARVLIPPRRVDRSRLRGEEDRFPRASLLRRSGWTLSLALESVEAAAVRGSCEAVSTGDPIPL